MLSETKRDESFPMGRFIFEAFGVIYRVDQSATGGGITLFVREDIPWKIVFIKNYIIEAFFIEINLKTEIVTKLLLQSKEKKLPDFEQMLGFICICL